MPNDLEFDISAAPDTEEATSSTPIAVNTSPYDWALDSDKDFYLLPKNSSDKYDRLPAGYYGTIHTPDKFYFRKKKIESDNLIPLDGNAMLDVISEVENFWKKRDAFKVRGFLHKRGILLHGKPGVGKTSTILLIIRKLIENDGIVIQIDNPGIATMALQLIRRIEPTRPIIGLMDDFETILSQHGEGRLLSLLDGESQIDGIVYLAATNYIDNIPDRFKARPSRFDLVRELHELNAQSRRDYLLKIDPSIQNIDRWVDATANFGIDQLKELVILVQCFGKDFQDAIDRTRKMKEKKK